jgi:hypothetical protein
MNFFSGYEGSRQHCSIEGVLYNDLGIARAESRE